MILSSTEPKESSRLSWNALNTQSFCSALIQGMDPDDMAPMYVAYTSLDQGRYEHLTVSLDPRAILTVEAPNCPRT